MKILDLEQRSPEWLVFRKNKIGASDAPIIMGDSPWKTPYQLWEEKLGLSEPTVNNAMILGNDMEDFVRHLVMNKTSVQYHPKVVIHDELHWMIASLDGLSQDRSGIIEIKVANADDHICAKSGDVPHKYHYQLYHQMAVTGLKSVLYCSFHPKPYMGDHDLAIVEFSRNDNKICEMIEKEKEFISSLENFNPPPLHENDYDVKVTPEWRCASENWKIANIQAKKWKNEEEISRKRLLELCQSKNSKGNGVRVQKIIRKGNVDYSSVPQLSGIDLEPYRKESCESWRISID